MKFFALLLFVYATVKVISKLKRATGLASSGWSTGRKALDAAQRRRLRHRRRHHQVPDIPTEEAGTGAALAAAGAIGLAGVSMREMHRRKEAMEALAEKLGVPLETVDDPLPFETPEGEPLLEEALDSEPVLVEEVLDSGPVLVEEAFDPEPVLVEEVLDSGPVLVEEAFDPEPVLVEEVLDSEPVLVEEAFDPEPVVLEGVAEPEPAPADPEPVQPAAETPADVPAETPAETSAETPAETPASIPAEPVGPTPTATATPTAAPPALQGPASPLEAAAELFAEGRPGFEVERLFEEGLKGRRVRWRGTLDSVERFHNDPTLGPGPGTKLVAEIAGEGFERPLRWVCAVADEGAREALAQARGEPVEVEGILSGCDPYLLSFTLTDGRLT